MQINKERKYHEGISIEEYMERRWLMLRGDGEKEEYAKLLIPQGDAAEWSDLFYT